MTREEYRETANARLALRNVLSDSLAPVRAELGAALTSLQKAHAEYIDGLRPYMGQPGTAEHQQHLATLEVCRDLIAAEQPLRDIIQRIEMAAAMGETEEWSERLGPLYSLIARAELTVIQSRDAIRKAGKPAPSAAFNAAGHGARVRGISKASLKPSPECPQSQIDKLAECIGL